MLSRDITKRKQNEQKLRDSEARFRGYFELGLVGIAITSPEKGWVEVNDRLCEMFGYTRSELLQKTWPEITHADDLAKTVKQFERVLAGEIDGYWLEKRFIQKDGTVIYGSVDVKCLRLDDGSVDYFVVMIQDITDRKLAVQASHEKQVQLDNLLSNVDAIILEGDPFEIYYVGGRSKRFLATRRKCGSRIRGDRAASGSN